MTTIELDVPFPKVPAGRPRHAGGVSQALRDLAQAPIGASVLIGDMSNRLISGYVSAATRQTGAKFSMRPVDGGTRVWRVA